MRNFHTLLAAATAFSLQAQVPSYVPTNGLVGWWPFSGNANDESGNGNNGIVNGAALTADRFGNQDQCYSFNGVDNYILILNSLLPSNEASYSISLWVNPNTFLSNYSEIMSDRGSVTYSHKYRISMADNGASLQPGTFYCLMGDGFGETHCYDTTYLNLNSWIHYVVVFNSALNEMRSYKNGALVENNQSTGIGSGYPNQLTSTYIGQSISPGGFDFGFHGLIDDVGIWDRSLDSCEVNVLFNAGNQGISLVPVSYTGLNSSYTVNDAPVILTGTPAGGVFIGPGVSGNTFDPASAGVGQHSIIYSYVDECGSVNSAGLCTEVTLNVGVGGSHMSTGGVHVYPNPNRGQFTVEVELTGLVSMQVFDARGRQVHNEVFQANGGKTQRTLDLSGLATGSYTVQVRNAGAVVTQQVVVE